MSEARARVNTFFNTGILFVEVTKSAHCTNMCASHIYIYVRLCVFSIYTYTYVRVSRFNRKGTLNSKSRYNHA